jgi:outer membrane protein assembly factor BamB
MPPVSPTRRMRFALALLVATSVAAGATETGAAETGATETGATGTGSSVGFGAGSDSTGDAVRWPQFRGPDAMPTSDNDALPSTWSTTENVEWVAEIPGMGWSSPIVWGDQVFLTTAVSEKAMKQPSLGVDFSNELVAELMQQGKTQEEVIAAVTDRDIELPDEIEVTLRLLSLDLTSGKVLWDRTFYTGPPPVGRHRKNSYASETPVTDGKAVYVYIAHLGLFAYDFEGKQLWHTPLEPHRVYLDFGAGASPALHDGRLYVLDDNEEASFIAAFDAVTGKELWRTARPGLGNEQMRSGWSTPFVWQHASRTEIVTSGPGAAISYDLDGRELWRLVDMGQSAIPTPFAWDGLLYLSSGTAGQSIKPIAAVRPGAAGTIDPDPGTEGGTASEHVAWYDKEAGGTYLPTPLIYDGRLFVLSDKGILDQVDPKTGKRIYRTRIHAEARNFTASPWAYDGKVFAINEEGTTFVIGAGETFELLGINRLDEFAMATPALAGDRLLVRTQGKLYSIRKKGGGAPPSS